MIRELETVGFEKTDKIFTASAQFAYLGASKVAEHFGISFPSFNAVEAILDKSIFYKNFSDLEINIPSTRLIKNKKELALALNELKTNCYLKSDRSKNPNYVYKIGATGRHRTWVGGHLPGGCKTL